MRYPSIWCDDMKQQSVVYLNSRKIADFEKQKIEIENFCKYRFEIERIFHDNQSPVIPVSNRPEFIEMVNYCSEKGICNIIFYDLDATLKIPDVFVSELSMVLKRGYIPYWALSGVIILSLRGIYTVAQLYLAALNPDIPIK